MMTKINVVQDKGISCPICLGQIVPEFIKQHNQYKIYRCPECDVVYPEPFQNPGAEWYEDIPFLCIKMPLGWQHKVFLSERHRLGESLLDLGCGNGLFPHLAKKRGYHAVGIDYNSAAINEGKKRFGLGDDELLCTSLEAYVKTNKTFDVVTLFETLEHLDNPNEVMENVKKLLKPNGLLILTVPNRNRFLDTIGEWDYPPMHLTQWSPKALERFVESNGFEVLAHKIKLVNGWEVAYFIETWLAGNAKQILRKEIIEGIRHNQKEDKSDPRTLLWKLFVIQLNIVSLLCYPLALFLRLLGGKGSQQYLLAKSRV
ncbi:MAG: class I SAM-dependent methyltransferase [Planctomycetota bacterium]|jgi:2-polyprenyl-3-methyl-5-hydroxy-6-metoxy-1,4-benzoquinol methylase